MSKTPPKNADLEAEASESDAPMLVAQTDASLGDASELEEDAAEASGLEEDAADASGLEEDAADASELEEDAASPPSGEGSETEEDLDEAPKDRRRGRRIAATTGRQNMPGKTLESPWGPRDPDIDYADQMRREEAAAIAARRARRQEEAAAPPRVDPMGSQVAASRAPTPAPIAPPNAPLPDVSDAVPAAPPAPAPAAPLIEEPAAPVGPAARSGRRAGAATTTGPIPRARRRTITSPGQTRAQASSDDAPEGDATAQANEAKRDPIKERIRAREEQARNQKNAESQKRRGKKSKKSKKSKKGSRQGRSRRSESALAEVLESLKAPKIVVPLVLVVCLALGVGLGGGSDDAVAPSELVALQGDICSLDDDRLCKQAEMIVKGIAVDRCDNVKAVLPFVMEGLDRKHGEKGMDLSERLRAMNMKYCKP